MNNIGKSERTTQNRIIQLLQKKLGFDYVGILAMFKLLNVYLTDFSFSLNNKFVS